MTCSGGVAAEVVGCSFALFDAQGKCPMRGTIGSWPLELDLAHLPSGMYSFRIASKAGPISLTMAVLSPP
jgi:hypothetical protein